MARWLAQVARHVGAARTAGRLYDLGAYPGLVPARRRGEWVIGDLYHLRAPRGILQTLDRYEAGHGRSRPRFVRVRCWVVLASGRQRMAWTYLHRLPILRRPRVRSGDYEAHLARD